MKKNRGESLVESLISMFFITLVILPVSNLLLKTFNMNSRLTDRSSENITDRNMLELLKTKDYEFIEGKMGEHVILDGKSFYNIVSLEEKYKILDMGIKDISLENKRNMKIRKTEDYYINEKGEKEYIFEITIGKVKGYYFPKLE